MAEMTEDTSTERQSLRDRGLGFDEEKVVDMKANEATDLEKQEMPGKILFISNLSN